VMTNIIFRDMYSELNRAYEYASVNISLRLEVLRLRGQTIPTFLSGVAMESSNGVRDSLITWWAASFLYD
jgi:hypothetical protein